MVGLVVGSDVSDLVNYCCVHTAVELYFFVVCGPEWVESLVFGVTITERLVSNLFWGRGRGRFP